MEEVFGALKTRYRAEWTDEEKNSFCLSFSGKRGYRIFACGDYAELAVRKRFFCWEYWRPVRHVHYDSSDDTAADILNAIEGLILSVS